MNATHRPISDTEPDGATANVRWEAMFVDELESAIARRPVCYLAYGLSEPHGVQNALGLDGLKADALAVRAARAHGGVVAPTTWWHVHETPRGIAFLKESNVARPFLTDVPADLFLRQLLYQLRAAENAGFRAAILITGHYGGIELDMKMAAAHYSAARPLRTAALADWEIIRYREYRGDHAGPCETSQLMALRPECVDLTRMPSEPMQGVVFASSERARQSSRREGEGIVASQVRELGRIAARLLAEAESQPAGGGLSMAAVETIWQTVLAERAEWVSEQPNEGFADAIARRARNYKKE